MALIAMRAVGPLPCCDALAKQECAWGRERCLAGGRGGRPAAGREGTASWCRGRGSRRAMQAGASWTRPSVHTDDHRAERGREVKPKTARLRRGPYSAFVVSRRERVA